MSESLPLRRKVVGAYHVATFPRWHEIVEAQCWRLKESGLLSRTSRLLVGVVGDSNEDVSLISDLLGQKATIRQLGPLSEFEFPTLQWLYEDVKSVGVACWYAHTKGASTRRDDQTKWRLKMEAVVFDQYERCLEALKDYDVCGTEWQSSLIGNHPHYSGNFWWANSRYLRTLPPPSSFQFKSHMHFDGPSSLAVGTTHFGRGEAEFWLGRNSQVKAFSI
jgi:hypothetical protein